MTFDNREIELTLGRGSMNLVGQLGKQGYTLTKERSLFYEYAVGKAYSLHDNGFLPDSQLKKCLQRVYEGICGDIRKN